MVSTLIKILVFIGLLNFASGCSLLTTEDKDSSPKYVQKNKLSYSSQYIKEQLTRETTMAGGQYEISIWPYTYPYVDSVTRESSSLRSLDAKETEKYRDQLLNKYVSSKTCFQFNYNVERFKEVKDLSSWELILKYNNNTLRLNTINKDQDSPFVSRVQKSEGKLPVWNQRAIACTDQSIPMEKGFVVQIKPQFVPWPFSKTVTLEWIFDEIIINEKGEKVIKKKKRKSYQGYRGY